MRVSRSRWLASCSTAALVGCAAGSAGMARSDATAPEAANTEDVAPDSETVSRQEASDASSDERTTPAVDALVEANGGRADGASCDASDAWDGQTGTGTPDGSFLCLRAGSGYPNLVADADVWCERNTQYCFVGGGASGNDGCWPLTGCSFLALSELVAEADGGCEGGRPTCGCLHPQTYFCTVSYSCSEDDAGDPSLSCGSLVRGICCLTPHVPTRGCSGSYLSR